MRLSHRPPPFSLERFAEQVSSGDFDQTTWLALLNVFRSPTISGKYLHWDKVRRLPAPEGLTHAQWWAGIKYNRAAMSKPVPLSDLEGSVFTYLLPDPVPETLRFIDTNACGTIGSQTKIPGHSESKRYLVRSLIEEAIFSSHLEGATTTRSVAKKIIRERRKPQNRSEQMILNNYYTMVKIGRLRDQPLSKELVLELHRLITDDTLDHPDQAGRFRRAAEKNWVEDVGSGERLHNPPPAEELPRRMNLMCRFANGETPEGFIHPVVRAVILHFWLAYDHPFVDGNGRCARALFYWSMLRNDYWLTEYLSISQHINKAPNKYRLAFLHTETDSNDLTYFVLWHLDVLQKAIADFNAYLTAKIKEIDRLQANLSVIRDLNYRQRELVAHALRNPGAEYTVKSHQNSHRITRQTSRTDLIELVQRKLLTGIKRGRTWQFYPADNLVRILENGAQDD